ncbi:fructose-6-phosphate aldolase [Lactobacillus porci]|uniref:Fructose-6-phosphate aldolase n=1 Tax=Lactobacillus porci TaxID=2012477 RepID=A0A6A8ME85_9LACO|nr:fructose-6-phosphate aldolase [Lactobacillus porci]MST87090.1 fructose-6-phosphate aldolase [Lactobacillus porci]
MEFMLDTADLAAIEYWNDHLQLSGITTNPTILKKAAAVDVFDRLRAIRKIIGTAKCLHVQVVGESAEEMVKDAARILQEVDQSVYIKVPTTPEGLKAMKLLKRKGVHITATAIYSEFQMYQAMMAKVDYMAPYFNRMVNQNVDAKQVIANVAKTGKRTGSKSKILAASFHNVQEVTDALDAGAQAVTVGVDVVASAFANPAISAAVAGFAQDWQDLHPGKHVYDL